MYLGDFHGRRLAVVTVRSLLQLLTDLPASSKG